MISSELILTIATSSLFIQLFHYYFYEKSFKESYEQFEKRFDEQLRKEITKDLEQLKNKAKDSDFDTVARALKGEAYKIQEISQPAIKYLEIHNRFKWFYILMFACMLLSIINLKFPDYLFYNISLLNWSFYSLITAVLLFIWMFIEIHKLRRQVLNFELGSPIEDLLNEKSK